MSKLLTIKEASEVLGVATSTLRRWEEEGRLKPDLRTKGGQRRYKLSTLLPEMKQTVKEERKTIAYARVSTSNRKDDLERQIERLESFCMAKGWSYKVISDIGSGINYNKKGLQTLIEEIMLNKVERVIVNYKDRLVRFGFELIEKICELKGVEIIIVSQSENKTFQQEMVEDIMSILRIFSAKLYGNRSHKNKKITECVKKIEEEINEKDN